MHRYPSVLVALTRNILNVISLLWFNERNPSIKGIELKSLHSKLKYSANVFFLFLWTFALSNVFFIYLKYAI